MEVDPPQSWPRKQNATTVVAADDSSSCEQLKCYIYFEKKLDFEL